MKTWKKVVSGILSAVLLMTFSVGVTAEDSEKEKRNTANRITAFYQTYPTGSYYSENGKACTCHVDKHAYYNLNTCNCGKYHYTYNGTACVSYQCDAFARYCYYIFNGSDLPQRGLGSIDVNFTTANLESYLIAMGTQSFVRGATLSVSGELLEHSIFIIGYNTNNDTVSIYDSNYDGACEVACKTLSYSQFVNRIRYLYWYCKSDGTLVDNVL